MERTKLGISLTLTALIIVCAAYFGGYIPALLLTGYVFWKEDSIWLKRMALETLLLMIVFSVLSLAIRLIPTLLNVPNSLFAVFNRSYLSGFTGVIGRLENLLESVLTIVKIGAFGSLGYMAFSGRTVSIAPLDRFLEKHC